MARKAQDHGHDRKIRICSDSRAAVTILDDSVTISMLIWECFETMNKLAKDNQVRVLWIPGYMGIKGNEIANRVAKLAAR